MNFAMEVSNGVWMRETTSKVAHEMSSVQSIKFDFIMEVKWKSEMEGNDGGKSAFWVANEI